MLERLRVPRLFNSSERARSTFSSAEVLAQRKFGTDPYTAVETAYNGIVKELIPGLLGDANVEQRASSIEIVGVESESVGHTHTEEFADGSALIRISDSMTSGCGQVFDLLAFAAKPYGKKLNRAARAWRSTKGDGEIDRRTVALATAALRYETIHQQVWAKSAKIGTSQNLRTRFTDKLTQHSHNSLIFILAHEMAHVVLGHTRTKLAATTSGSRLSTEQLHAWELEADLWALQCLERLPSLTAWKTGERLEGAVVALIAIHMNSGPLFVRIPSSHPDTGHRINQLLEGSTARLPESSPFLEMLLDAAGNAAATGEPVPAAWWDGLLSAPEFDSSWHSPDYFRMIRSIDDSRSWSPEVLRKQLDKFQSNAAQGVEAAMGIDFARVDTALSTIDRAQNVESTLTAVGVDDGKPIVDPSVPLSVAGLVEALLDSVAFEEAVSNADSNGDDPTLARIMAFWIAHRLHPRLAATM